MIKLKTSRWIGHFGLLAGVLLAGPAVAAPPAAPAGFTWQFVNSQVYTDSDSGSVTLNDSGNYGTPEVTSLAQSLSVTTFNQASSPSGFYYDVTSSTYTASLLGSTNASLFNFSGTATTYGGNLSLAGFSIGGAGSAVPVSSSLSNSSTASVPSFGGPLTFVDASSGASGTSASTTASGGISLNNGSNLNFTFNGNSVAGFNAASGATSGLFTVAGSASYSAGINTAYDVYELVAVPEPTGPAFAAALLGCALIRRRRRSA